MGYAAAPRVAFIVYGIQTFFYCNHNNNKGTGVGQVGSIAYHGDVDDPAHHSLGWCLLQVPVTPSHPCQGYDKGVGGIP